MMWSFVSSNQFSTRFLWFRQGCVHSAFSKPASWRWNGSVSCCRQAVGESDVLEFEQPLALTTHEALGADKDIAVSPKERSSTSKCGGFSKGSLTSCTTTPLNTFRKAKLTQPLAVTHSHVSVLLCYCFSIQELSPLTILLELNVYTRLAPPDSQLVNVLSLQETIFL